MNKNNSETPFFKNNVFNYSVQYIQLISNASFLKILQIANN